MNLCKDCKHHELIPATWICMPNHVCHRDGQEITSPITGNKRWSEGETRDCETERMYAAVKGGFMQGQFCEPTGNYFEPKE